MSDDREAATDAMQEGDQADDAKVTTPADVQLEFGEDDAAMAASEADHVQDCGGPSSEIKKKKKADAAEEDGANEALAPRAGSDVPTASRATRSSSSSSSLAASQKLKPPSSLALPTSARASSMSLPGAVTSRGSSVFNTPDTQSRAGSSLGSGSLGFTVSSVKTESSNGTSSSSASPLKTESSYGSSIFSASPLKTESSYGSPIPSASPLKTESSNDSPVSLPGPAKPPPAATDASPTQEHGTVQ